MRIALVTSILVALPAALDAQGAPTARNWRTHPEVVAVRAVYDSVERLIARRGASVASKSFEFCENGAESERKLWTDSAGRAVKYLSAGGSEDSFATTTLYYDRAQRLRFLFITSASVHGRATEDRLYLDTAGVRVWEDHRITRGQGYRPEPVDTEHLVRDPKRAFAAPPPCEEEGDG